MYEDHVMWGYVKFALNMNSESAILLIVLKVLINSEVGKMIRAV